MGTNFYLHTAVCPTCGRGEYRHIGKSSAGWVFALHVYPEDDIHDLPDWERLWTQPGAVIKNEYGEVITPKEMKSRITERGRATWEDKPYGYSTWSLFHLDNGSMRGPKNLLRSKINGHVIGHGVGTWDLVVGDFS